MTQPKRERSKTLPLSQVAVELLKQLDYELKAAGDSAYKESIVWTRFARRAEPVLRELAQMMPVPRVVQGLHVETKPK